MPFEPVASDELRNAYAQFVSDHEFNYYITQTFKHTRRDATVAARSVGQMYEYYGASHSFVAVEPHKLDGIHLHSLVNFPEPPPIDRLKRQSDKYGFYNLQYLTEETFTVANYCAKYVTKGNEYFLMGSPGAWKTFDKR